MVLEGAPPEAALPPNNNAVPSSPGGYLTPNPAFARYFPLQVKPELAVKPDLFTLYFGFFGVNNWRRNIASHLTDRIETQWIVTNRYPTQNEMDVYTTATSRGLYYKTIGLSASAFLATGWEFRRLTKSPAWPGLAPTPSEFWRLLKITTQVNGSVFLQNAGRSAFRILFFTTTGWMVTAFMGAYSDAQTVLMDPSMDDFKQDIKHISQEEIRKRRLFAAVDGARRRKAGEVDITGQIVERLSGRGGYDQGQSNYDDSASPTALYESDKSDNTSQYDQENYSTGQSQPQVYGTSRGMANEPTSQSDLGNDFFFGGSGDDASPTAPEYRNTNPDGSSTGSVWDRIRRQNVGPSQQPPARPRMQQWGQPQNASGSEYAPSNNQDRYNMEKRRDKEQAHAEFNQIVENEKNAYSDTSAQNRGWGS
ncbi:uncharacterized protein N7443_006524 [Penicillium atrosanguineum]|uniref:uncharacterized protein n=1 Tax=Penicillium atrosanguineum TaxID=1132637 RepID=UPI002391AFE4|nr:uncharacterized protein N7443_006524 [Penicillium atrosanguineum]KAJ5141809.1 hypothetical protein N7526_002804 [Penicillium atrosanguineum]KAJ5298404.1 hypothetical protein N7443_006524 [Penicillium atrosanguineum]